MQQKSTKYQRICTVNAECITHVFHVEGSAGVNINAGKPYFIPPHDVSKYLPRVGDYLILDGDTVVEVVPREVFDVQFSPINENKVSNDRIDSLMEKLTFSAERFGDTTLTIATARLPNGFTVAIGESACVDPNNFDADKGKDYAICDAYSKANKKLWELEGYALAQKINPVQ